MKKEIKGRYASHEEVLEKCKEGFYKVDQSGSSFIVDTYYNPERAEALFCCVRDYDYTDCRRDNDELYHMPVHEEMRRVWLHDNGEILAGDTVMVVKGRKIPIGTKADVVEKRPICDKYGRVQAIYLYLDNGMRTNENNCVMVQGR